MHIHSGAELNDLWTWIEAWKALTEMKKEKKGKKKKWAFRIFICLMFFSQTPGLSYTDYDMIRCWEESKGFGMSKEEVCFNIQTHL